DQVTTSEVTVNDADSNGKPDSQDAAEAAAEAAVKAAEDKKAEVEADGVVNPDEKSAVDGLNDVTTEKK
ncbi:GA-like domain-containing protein, partial [Streptococcus agalactiae]|uniref:GA-like domain-containing protein n=1 Tax=Streptococcus agalactiae TaxID=1311 RepID=UPI000B0943F2